MKKLLSVVVIVLALVIGFVAYVFLTLDPEKLGNRILGMINENTGVSVTAEKFEVRPLQGVNLEGGQIEGDLESGSLSGEIDRMVLDYKLLPILKGEVVIHQILVESPNLEVVSKPSPAAEPPTETPADEEPAEGVETREATAAEAAGADEPGFVSAVTISEIRISDGNLALATEGSDSGGLRVAGFDLELGDLAMDSSAASPLLGFAARGGLAVDTVQSDSMTIKGGRGVLVVDRGRMAVTDLGIETPNASLEIAELAADLTQDPPPYRLEAGGSYDVNSLVEAEGEGFGPASLEFTAQGSGPELDNLLAEGSFRLEDGQIPAFPMMVKIEKLLGQSLIVGFPYEGTDIVFAIEEGVARVEPFVMGFENLQMAGGGVIDLDGPIDMQIDVRVPRDSVSSSVLDPFIDGMTDENGWTTVPFNIAGTMAEPDVSFDMTSIKNTAKDMGKRAVTNALDSAVDDLKERTFGRRRKDDG